MMKKYLAELFGTFMLILCGTGAIVLNEATQGAVTSVGISIAFGLIVTLMIYAVGHISGAHINPAVTIGFWLSGKLQTKDVPGYIIAQLIGGTLASVLLLFLYPASQNLGATLPSGGWGQSFVLEIALTTILMLVIILFVTGPKKYAAYTALGVGAVVGLAAAFGGPVSGASMNPARSFGPALVSGELQYLWIYLTAPVVGAALGILGCRSVKGKACCQGPMGGC